MCFDIDQVGHGGGLDGMTTGRSGSPDGLDC